MTPIEQPERESALSTSGLLWVCVLLGPAAWAVQLQTVYAVAQQACQGDLQLATLHTISAVCLLLALAGGILAVWQWRRAGAGSSSEHGDLFVARQRFMSFEGMMTGFLFALVIIAQWLSVFYLSPCPA